MRMSLIRKVGETIKTVVRYHDAHQRFYSQIIDRDRLYYGRRDAIEPSVAERHMPMSIELIIFPSLIMVIMIARCVFSLFWNEQFALEERTKFGLEIFAGGGRIQIEYCMALWSMLFLLSAGYESSRPELDFRYLSIWSSAREAEGVGPWQLTPTDHDRLRLYRDRMTSLESTICLGDLPIAFVSLLISPLLTQEKSIYLLYPFSAWFWLFYTVVWAAYAIRIGYGTPSRFVVVSYCLQLKQHHLLERLTSIQQRSSVCMITFRLFMLYRADRRLANELAAYNRFWSGQLSILLEVYVLVITYLAYVIMWPTMPASYYFIVCLIFGAHVLWFSLLANICVRLVRLDRKIGRQLNQLYQRSLTKRGLQPCSRIRLGNMATNRIWDTKRSFLIWNKQIINFHYCLKILASMVALFLLTVKQQLVQ